MFVVEEKASGKYVGRVGPWSPPGWPGFEVGWGIANGIPWQGLCGRSGAGVDRLGRLRRSRSDRDHPLHRSREHGLSSRRAAARARKDRESIVRQAADIWVTSRASWAVAKLNRADLRLNSGDARDRADRIIDVAFHPRHCLARRARWRCCWCWRRRCCAISERASPGGWRRGFALGSAAHASAIRSARPRRSRSRMRR